MVVDHIKICSHKSSTEGVPSSIIHNSQMVEIAQMSINRWIKKIWYIQTMEYYWTSRKKEVLIHAAIWMNLEDSVLREIIQSPKNQILYDSSSMKYLKHLSFTEAESRMIVARAGEGGMGSYWSTSAEFHFCEMKRVLWMDRGDGNVTMWLQLIPLSWTPKNGWDGNFYTICILPKF